MDKQYMVVLWNDKFDEAQDIYPHKIESFETLKDAVICLVNNGARYDHKEIVQKVDWMPGDIKPAMVAPVSTMTQEEQELAKIPNPTTPIADQPQVIDATPKPKMKRSIFEGVLPDSMIPALRNDD